VAQLLAEDEEDSFHLTRKLLSYMPGNNLDQAPFDEDGKDLAPENQEELNSVVPVEAMRPYDMHHVIQKIFDSGDFSKSPRTLQATSLPVLPDWEDILSA
jgi:Acetyl-CoA carboxylase, carboxyltransferase component (subunits alpha and beta)